MSEVKATVTVSGADIAKQSALLTVEGIINAIEPDEKMTRREILNMLEDLRGMLKGAKA